MKASSTEHHSTPADQLIDQHPTQDDQYQCRRPLTTNTQFPLTANTLIKLISSSEGALFRGPIDSN